MPNKQLIVPLEFDLYTAISMPGFWERNEPIQGKSASGSARNWCAAYELMHDAQSGDTKSNVHGVWMTRLTGEVGDIAKAQDQSGPAFVSR
jgi:hypothetical protein